MNSKAAFALIHIVKQLVHEEIWAPSALIRSPFSVDSLWNCLTDLDNLTMTTDYSHTSMSIYRD